MKVHPLNGRSMMPPDAQQTKPLLATSPDGVDLAEAIDGAEAVKVLRKVDANETSSSGEKKVPSLLAKMAEKQPASTIKTQLSPQDMAAMAEMVQFHSKLSDSTCALQVDLVLVT